MDTVVVDLPTVEVDSVTVDDTVLVPPPPSGVDSVDTVVDPPDSRVVVEVDTVDAITTE